MAQSLFVSSESFSETRITLDNKIFYLVLRWNTREGAWYLDLLDVNKTILTEGNKVVFGSSPTFKLSRTVLNGNLYVYNTDDSKASLGRDNFGQGKKYELIYLTTQEELDLSSGA